MSRLTIRFTPVNGYDIPSLEGWLERQAAKGLTFALTAGPFTIFERGALASLRYHLEPAPSKPDWTDPELNALYEEAGWRYLGLFRRDFAVFVTEDPQAQAHTDPQIWDHALKRFFRRKLLGGLGLLVSGLLLLSLYWQRVSVSWYDLRWSPIETMSRCPLIPLILSVLGLALVDLSWLLGLISLHRHRRAVSAGRMPPRHTRGGGLLAAGTLLLAVVLAETLILFTGLSDRSYPLEGSGFVTLEEIEGPDLQISLLWPDYMDRISHDRSLLMPERWYFQERAWAGHGVPTGDAPYLKLSACRYLFPWLAEERAKEESRILWNGGEYQPLAPVCGLDQILISHDTFDPERDAYPRTRLVLRQGDTVLFVEYQGEQDLARSLPRFAQMMEGL